MSNAPYEVDARIQCLRLAQTVCGQAAKPGQILTAAKKFAAFVIEAPTPKEVAILGVVLDAAEQALTMEVDPIVPNRDALARALTAAFEAERKIKG